MNAIDGVSYCEVCNYFEGAFGCVDGACRKPPEPQKALYMGLAAAYPDVPVVSPAECVTAAPVAPSPPTANAKCPQCPHLPHAANACNGDAQSGHRCLCLSAPTENARDGADEACFGSCDRMLSPKRIAEGHTLCVQCQSLWDRAVAAGRARGIEEGKKERDDLLLWVTEVGAERTSAKSKLLGLAAIDTPWIKNEGLLCCPICDFAHHQDDYAGTKVHERDCVFQAIADAIAKETGT